MILQPHTRGLIFDLFPGDSSPVVDVNSVAIMLRYSAQDNAATVVNVPFVSAGVPQAVQDALSNAQVQPTPTNGLSFPAHASAVITQLVTNINNQFSALSPGLTSNLLSKVTTIPGVQLVSGPTFPHGLVRARQISGGPLLLDLWISPISAQLVYTLKTLNLHTYINLTLDAELLFMVFAQLPSVQVIWTSNLLNTSIQPTSLNDAINLAAADALWGWLYPENPGAAPSNQIALAETMTNYSAIVTSSSNPSAVKAIDQSTEVFGDALSTLWAAGLPLGLIQDGFSAAAALNPTLQFVMNHPIDPAPIASNPQVPLGGYPSFTHPTLGSSQLSATPGQQLAITGTYFTPTTPAAVTWTDTCSGAVTSSDVEWNLASQWGSQPPNSVNIPAASETNATTGDFLFVAPVAPQSMQAYTFRVRNSDALTTTQYSNLVTVQSVFDVVNFILTYQSPGGPNAVAAGTATVGSDGTFTALIKLPLDAVPNVTPAKLCAWAFGQQIACISIPIVATIEPVLNLINPLTGTIAAPSVQQGLQANLTARGEGFTPGGNVSLYIDDAESNPVGAEIVGANGTFVVPFEWPTGLLPGAHSLISIEEIGLKTVQADLTITQQEPLQ